MNSTTDDYSLLMSSSSGGGEHGYCNNRRRPTTTTMAKNRLPPSFKMRRSTAAAYHKINPFAYPGSKRYESIEKRRSTVVDKSMFRCARRRISSLSPSSTTSTSSQTSCVLISSPPPPLLKDHFAVINHKQESIFEPKSASTPIYQREQKTSTPLLEKVLFRLVEVSRQKISIIYCASIKTFIIIYIYMIF